MYHESVMLNECIDGLAIKPDGIYVDATFGGGGHSKKILEQLSEKGKLIAIDQDEDVRANLPDDDRLMFIHGNFRYIQNYLNYYKINKVDGILADLGVSWHHFDDESRGFSFMSSMKLDMRMNKSSEKDAALVLNTYDENELTSIFRNYGEVDFARKLASEIIALRGETDFSQTPNLVSVIDKFIPSQKRNKVLAQVFQALRIEVNDEINALLDFLNACAICTTAGGRLVVLSYHSLEDRLVKNLIKTGNTDGIAEHDLYGLKPTSWDAVNRKIILPSEQEISMNSKARSAKLRIAIRTDNA